VTISLDYHATTPTAQDVIDAMAPFWQDCASNAHSAHAGGAEAERAVEMARGSVADLVGAVPSEIIFTSGATEANNLAILGCAAAARSIGSDRRRILTTAIEHKCVLEAARHLAGQGFTHEVLPVTADGFVDVEHLASRLREDVLLVAVQAANNEIGTIQPLREVADVCATHSALLHVDAAQAAGRIPFDVVEIGCDTASLSAHKMYGPKGAGALFISAATPLRPQPIMFGGGQEQALRPGTLPVPLIVGFGRAADIAMRDAASASILDGLAKKFLAELERRGVRAVINGNVDRRLPGSLNFYVPDADAEDVVLRVGDKLHLSTGSACQSGELQGSYVLRALGLPSRSVSASFRACFGRGHSEEDARLAAAILADALTACDRGAGRRVQWQGQAHGDVRVE